MIAVGRCQIIIGVKGCVGCGVEFSRGWFEKKETIVIRGKRHEISLPVCAACIPFHSSATAAPGEPT
jgi:hypothetical protein